MNDDEVVDKKSLKYVLYARRSTKADGQQQRSLSDQVRLCKEVARVHGLNIVSIVREKESAKTSGKRHKFDDMLNDINAGKFNAILSLHPDRLARNMLEAGVLIDMLDDGRLKDITFQSYEFTNDDNGKMMLGMLFVFSKQYSDNLSKRVTIGVRGNLRDGKSGGTPRFGYDRNEETGLYEPNKFFPLVQKAWAKRLAGESLESITKFLGDEGYRRTTKRGKTIKPSLNAVSQMFRRPFYFGLLVQAGQIVDLRQPPFVFQPMVSEEDYNQIQAMSAGRTKDKNPNKRTSFLPLREMVFCAVCNSNKYMKVGKPRNGSGVPTLSYRCDTSGCTRKHKSMRAHYIFDSIYATLDSLSFSDGAYLQYVQDIDALTEQRIVEIKEQIQSKRGAVHHINGEINTRSLNLGTMDKSSAAYKVNEDKVELLSQKRDGLNKEINRLGEKVAGSNIKVNKDEFLNLVKTVADKMRKGNSVQKDTLARILFLNVRVDSEKVVDYLWNEPFASLVKYSELSFGGDGRN